MSRTTDNYLDMKDKAMNIKFEDFLRDKFMEDRPETLDDEMPDKFEAWLATKDVNDIIEYAQEALNNL